MGKFALFLLSNNYSAISDYIFMTILQRDKEDRVSGSFFFFIFM